MGYFWLQKPIPIKRNPLHIVLTFRPLFRYLEAVAEGFPESSAADPRTRLQRFQELSRYFCSREVSPNTAAASTEDQSVTSVTERDFYENEDVQFLLESFIPYLFDAVFILGMYGDRVLIHDEASLYNVETLEITAYVRLVPHSVRYTTLLCTYMGLHALSYTQNKLGPIRSLSN